MNLDIALWVGGTFFSLGIFAVKVGFGLGFGRVGVKSAGVALAGYVVLFMMIALLSKKLMGMIAPVLTQGPYLHVLMAAGMLAWGIYAIRGSRCMHQNGQKEADSMLRPSLLLIIPCPVCLAAMTFSTWSALSVTQLPAVFVGLGLGLSFAALALLFLFIARFGKSESPETPLGLAMITIGLYYVASLFLPAKIEEARGIYESFVDKIVATDHKNLIGVLLTLCIAMLIGYFGKEMEHKK
jgi:predicted transporter